MPYIKYSLLTFILFISQLIFSTSEEEYEAFRKEFNHEASKLTMCKGMNLSTLNALPWKEMPLKKGGFNGSFMIALDTQGNGWVKKSNTAPKKKMMERNKIFTFGKHYLEYMRHPNNKKSLIIPICAISTEENDWAIYMPQMNPDYQKTFDIKVAFQSLPDDKQSIRNFLALVGGKKFIPTGLWKQLHADFNFLKSRRRWDFSVLIGFSLSSTGEVSKFDIKIIDILMESGSRNTSQVILAYNTIASFWYSFLIEEEAPETPPAKPVKKSTEEQGIPSSHKKK